MDPTDGTYTGGGSNNSPGTGGAPISGSNGETVTAGNNHYRYEVLSGSDVYIKTSHPASFNVDSGARADLSASPDVPVTLRSTQGSATLVGNGGQDTIRSLVGNDTIYAGGDSKVFGGPAGDTIYGGRIPGAHDTITTGTGGDSVQLYTGSNKVNGSANDTIRAGNGHDTIFGGTGPETIYGGKNTTIYGGGQAKIHAGSNDTISVSGHDTLFAGKGTNSVSTAKGSHTTIDGNEGGKLTVYLGKDASGNDTIFGGANGHGQVTINVKYGSGQDTISSTKDTDGRTVVNFAGGQTLHVSNVTIDFNDGTHTKIP